MKRLWSLAAGAAVLALAPMLSVSPAAAACTAGLDYDGNVYIRSGPSTDFEPVGSIPGKTCGIHVGRCEGEWCEVDFEGIRGWSSADYLRPGPGDRGPPIGLYRPPRHDSYEEPRYYSPARPDPYYAPRSDLYYRPPRDVCVYRTPDGAPGVPFRAGPSAEYEPIGWLHHGDCARVVGACQFRWCRVERFGRIGWVDSLYVR